MKYKLTMVLVLTFFLFGCEDDAVWEEVDEPDKLEEVLTFMEMYQETWSKSLNDQHYSLMERYFVPNSHVYHMQRRQHQQIISERKVENFQGYSNAILEKNQYEEFRFRWTEYIAVIQGDSVLEEEQTRIYYLTPAKEDYRITAIERQ